MSISLVNDFGFFNASVHHLYILIFILQAQLMSTCGSIANAPRSSLNYIWKQIMKLSFIMVHKMPSYVFLMFHHELPWFWFLWLHIRLWVVEVA